MSSVEFSVTQDGNLLIAMTAQGYMDLEQLLAHHADWSEDDLFTELIDYQLSNGWSSVPLTQVRAQGSSIILSNNVRYDDEGNITYVGDAYWYPGYKHLSYTSKLLKDGFIIFEYEGNGNKQ